ncbi:MAG: hypothetical protein AB1486_00680 [Planctomycetota bacterium]
MQYVRLFHWNADEAEERIAALRAAGYEVDYDVRPDAAWRDLRADPPAAIVIDLGRLPSHGRAVALALREQKSTRHVPLVFIQGDREKTARLKRELPDATFTTWGRIRTALGRAIARPPKEPIVLVRPDYSARPLAKKLGIQTDTRVALLGAPEDFEATLGKLPDGVVLCHGGRRPCDLAIWFVKSRRDLERGMAKMAALPAGGGGLWVAWPKKTSGVRTDLTQNVVREVALAAGLVDYKVCAIDATWSGFRLAPRRGGSPQKGRRQRRRAE